MCLLALYPHRGAGMGTTDFKQNRPPINFRGILELNGKDVFAGAAGGGEKQYPKCVIVFNFVLFAVCFRPPPLPRKLAPARSPAAET